MTYSDIQQALQILGLETHASLREIKTRHRTLVKRYHPDTGATDEPEKIRLINAAYKIIMEYVADYRFSFSEAEFYEQNPEARILWQFADDPLWGK